MLRNVSVSIPTFSRTLKMKLRLLNFSVATFALAALFLPRHCVASGEAGPSRWAPSAPPERPHSQFARASRYKDKISPTASQSSLLGLIPFLKFTRMPTYPSIRICLSILSILLQLQSNKRFATTRRSASSVSTTQFCLSIGMAGSIRGL